METTTAKKHEFKFSSSHDNYLVDVGDSFLFNGFPSLSLRKDCKPYESSSIKSIYAIGAFYPYVGLESLLEASKVPVQVINWLSSLASEADCKFYESSSTNNAACITWGTPNTVSVSFSRSQKYNSRIFSFSDKQIKEAKREMKTAIESYLQLKDNWNGYGASRISEKAVRLSLAVLPCIPSDYSVFPTKSGGVGFQSRSDMSPFLFMKIDKEGRLYSYLRKQDGSYVEKTDDNFSIETVAQYVASQSK
jgi:hypothetical protein